MGRIYGLVEWSGERDVPRLIDEMRDRIPPYPDEPVSYERLVRGRVALGLVARGQSFSWGIAEAASERCIVVYNGLLPGLGDLFVREGLPRGRSVGENLIALYRARGDDFLKIIPGMFMLALHDAEKDRLLIAGDRSGYFPLYFTAGPKRFAFASSIKPIKALLDSIRPNPAAFVDTLLFDAIAGGTTFYEGIEVVPYGGYVAIDLATKRVERRRYFRYEELFDAGEYERNRNINAPAALTATLKECLGRIFEGRDPRSVGLSCGGGIDCSYVGSVMREIGHAVPVFCTNVPAAGVTEAHWAKDTADRVGVELHYDTLNEKDYYALLLRVIAGFDQPIVHPNSAKSFVGARNIRAHGRRDQVYGVASDLLFGGFGNVRSYYRYLKIRKLLRLTPAKARTILAAGVNDLETVNVGLRMRNTLAALAGAGMGNFERAGVQAGVERALSGIPDPYERALKILMVENLCDYQQHLLNRRYETSSVSGISLFFPFLDLAMIRFALNLPVRHCVNWTTSKVVVRRAALPYLGAGIAARKKWGGDIPLTKWVTPLKFLIGGGFVEEVLRLDSKALMPHLERNQKLLWNLIDFELWGKLCVEGVDPESLLARIREQGIACNSYGSIEI